MTFNRSYELTFESKALDYSETVEVNVELYLEGARDEAYVCIERMWIEDEGKEIEVKLDTLENEIESDDELVWSLLEDYDSYRADYLYDMYHDR